MSVDLLIRGGSVLPEPATGQFIEDGFVAIQGSRIAAVGPASEIPDWARDPSEVIDAGGCVVMPGIVNAHTHLAGNIFRGIIEEQAATSLHHVAFPTEQFFEPEDMYWLGLLGLIETVKAGCTTVNDIYYFAASLAEAAKKIGIRAVLAEKIFDADFNQIRYDTYVRLPEQRRRKMQLAVDLVEQWHGANDGLITCRIGTHAPDTCSQSMLAEARELAMQLGVGLHIHTAQSPREVELIKAEHGCTPVEYLDSLGYLGPGTICVHCRFNSESDNARVAETRTGYAHCPTVYPRRGAYPPLWEFLSAGMVTGFGTDWVIMDPWEGMRHAMYWMRAGSGDPAAMQASEALALHTSGGATILGLETGTLAPGLLADVILVDVQQPHLVPFYGNIAGLLYHASRHDVRTSVVGGNVIMNDRRVVGVDEGEAIREVQARIPRFQSWLQSVRP